MEESITGFEESLEMVAKVAREKKQAWLKTLAVGDRVCLNRGKTCFMAKITCIDAGMIQLDDNSSQRFYVENGESDTYTNNVLSPVTETNEAISIIHHGIYSSLIRVYKRKIKLPSEVVDVMIKAADDASGLLRENECGDGSLKR